MNSLFRQRSLEELVELASGQVDPREVPYCSMPHVGGDNIESHSGRITGTQTASELGLKSGKYLFDPSYILYSKIRPNLNKVAAPSFSGICSADIYPIRPLNSEIDKRFLLYVLRSKHFLAYASKHSTRTNIPKINRPALLGYRFPLPPLPEQKRIADILDKADVVLRKRQEAVSIASKTTSCLFYQEFGDPLFNPKEWDVVELDNVSHKITDGVHFRPTYTNEGIPFVSVKDITTGQLRFDDAKFVSEEAHAEYIKRCHPERDDVLLTKVGATYGRPALVDTDRPFSIYVSVALIKPDRTKIAPVFLKEVLASDELKRQADRAIKGAGVPDLHLTEIRKFKVPLPPLTVQEDFVAKSRAIHTVEEKLRSATEQQSDLFNSLVQRAFKGEL